MTILESMLISLFCMAVVFSVLAILWALIRLFSSVIRRLEGRSDTSSGSNS